MSLDTRPKDQISADRPPKPSAGKKHLWQAFLSAFAAAFGVQSDKNRKKDFAGSSPWPYIFAGLAFTVIFVLVLVLVVNLVLS